MKTPRLPDPYTHVRKIRFLFWSWHVTDGPVGPILWGPGRTWTARGARRKAADAVLMLHAEARS